MKILDLLYRKIDWLSFEHVRMNAPIIVTNVKPIRRNKEGRVLDRSDWMLSYEMYDKNHRYDPNYLVAYSTVNPDSFKLDFYCRIDYLQLYGGKK